MRECHRQNKPSSNLPSHSGYSRVFAPAGVSFLCRVLRCTLERTGITSLKRGKGKRRAPSGFCSVVFVLRLGPAARENRTIIVHAHLLSYMGEAPGVPTYSLLRDLFCFADEEEQWLLVNC
ncbi:hypothetical protein CH063_15459 [Colletotrichum higginsianum]|uniref:Uncharacterized protein n=1 Tax=Colletotrichum higginsianum (strain IMI 349063) TaxID=759273 RepID=H1W2V9_COLHI|nr:hypothetical protein CH063_15459 [Colletotrichum higginsianum]